MNVAKRTYAPQPLRDMGEGADRFADGEWVVIGNGTVVEVGPIRIQQVGIARHRNHVVADRTLRANAALISAAPDLLQAARAVLADISRRPGLMHGALVDMLREAIQKATTEVEE